MAVTTEEMRSSSRAFTIPELLEAILSHLSMKDLLCLQRVARLWKATVERSSRLRQALFVEPIPSDTAWIIRYGSDPPITDSPRSARLGPLAVQQVPTDSIDKEQLEDRKGYCFPARLNDLLLERGHWRPLSLHERAESGEGVRVVRPRCPVLGVGSRMFLTQPPCCHLSLWLNWGRPIPIHEEEGIRFEDVLREIEGSSILPYLPHVFMQLKDVVCLTEADEKHVADRMEKQPDADVNINESMNVTTIGEPAVQRREGRVYMWRND